MGQKRDFTQLEKTKIVKFLLKGYETLKISKLLKRDHRIIKNYVKNSQGVRKKRVEKKWQKLTDHDLRRIKRELSRNPLVSSAKIFESCNITGVGKTTRCKVLQGLGKVLKVKTRPPLNQNHKCKRMEWAQQYIKTDFSKVLWTDEMRVTLDGPDGWARGWVIMGCRRPRTTT